jgi:clathrin heavy chain
VVVELAWMNGLMDFAMPYMVQFIKEVNSKVELLMSERKEAKVVVEAQQVRAPA